METAEQSQKELYDEQRREKMREEARRERKKNSKYYIFIIFTVAVIGGLVAGVIWLGWSVFRRSTPQQEDRSQTFISEGQEHVIQGTPVTAYKTNPPTSGPHWPEPPLDGVYDKGVPDEAMVHGLEHGRIWISYKPSISDAIKEKLRTIATSQTRVILSERPANDTDIALAAWTRLDTFNLSSDGSVDEQRILDFILRYRDKAPEYVPVMTGKQY
jgi:hypothetical protein